MVVKKVCKASKKRTSFSSVSGKNPQEGLGDWKKQVLLQQDEVLEDLIAKTLQVIETELFQWRYEEDNMLDETKAYKVLVSTLLDLFKSQRDVIHDSQEGRRLDEPLESVNGKQFIYLPGIDINTV